MTSKWFLRSARARLWLEDGTLRAEGPAPEIVERYRAAALGTDLTSAVRGDLSCGIS